jgi:hypothetical protein
MKRVNIILGITVAGGLVVAGVYFIFFTPVPSENRAGPSVASTTGQSPVSAREVPAGSREYRSEHYRFSLLYPDTLKVIERDEGQGAMTITFENVATLEGFQIFILPYSRAQITEDRFKKDIPSGVRTNVSSIKIDGASGAAFFSKDPNLGETREVWFLFADPPHGLSQHLYEVTTVKSLDTWLQDILQTWQFI